VEVVEVDVVVELVEVEEVVVVADVEEEVVEVEVKLVVDDVVSVGLGLRVTTNPDGSKIIEVDVSCRAS
jgi:hypothetical protein